MKRPFAKRVQVLFVVFIFLLLYDFPQKCNYYWVAAKGNALV